MITESTPGGNSVLAQPLVLSCGLVLPNRILKAAMGEGLADPSSSDVTSALIRLYERWADGGAGTLVTGVLNIQRGAGDASLVALDNRTDTGALAEWAAAVRRRDVRLIGQLVHQGRQTTVLVARHPLAPSALPSVRHNRVFGSSRALTEVQIADLVDRFARAAVMLEEAGFDGVEVHAAHGYLIGQFLSPATNLRTDQWGGSVANRARFLLEVVRRIRARVSPGFAVLVKINASDFQPGGFDIEDSAHVVGLLDSEGVDLVEVSGGTYESRSGALGIRPDEPGTSKDAYFAGFAPRLRQVTGIPLALTGGLRSRAVMEGLIRDGIVDVVGLARPLVEHPDAPRGLLDATLDRIDLSGPPSAAGADELLWYMAQFRRLADGQDFDPDYSIRSLRQRVLITAGQQALANARSTVHDLLRRA